MHEPRKYYDAVDLPKVIRERDTEYQLCRIIYFQRLLVVSIIILYFHIIIFSWTATAEILSLKCKELKVNSL